MAITTVLKKKKPGKSFFKALYELELDFGKLQSKVYHVFEIGRKEGMTDMEIGNYVRDRMKVHYSDWTIRDVLKEYPGAKHLEHSRLLYINHEPEEISGSNTEEQPTREHEVNEHGSSRTTTIGDEKFVNKIICGDALSVLKTFPSESIDCCCTSPPYYLQRDYQIDGQLGMEKSHTEYIDKLVEIFGHVRRVLKDKGSCWIVIGDSEKEKNRSLLCIPERLALAMTDQQQEDGWILRSKIIWWKRNATPSSAKDRFTVDYETVLWFVKSPQGYYFETQYEPHNSKYEFRYKSPFGGYGNKSGQGAFNYSKPRFIKPNPLGRIKRSVWDIPVEAYKGTHFAVFPSKLIETPIKATCPQNGIVLDPFMGSGTTALIAMNNGRKFIGIELNQKHIDLANDRLLVQNRLIQVPKLTPKSGY